MPPHTADLVVRLPESKRYMKKKLEDIATRAGLSLNSLMVLVIDDFLKRRAKTIEL